MRKTALLAAALLLGIRPGVARAGNDDEVTIGNQAALAAGAVTATGSDGAAAWYNPAGVAAVSADTVDVSGSAFSIRHYRMPRFLSASTGEHENASTTSLVSIPSALTLVRPISDRVRVGLGVFVPRQSDDSVRETLYTAAPVSTWIFDFQTSSQSYHAGVTFAVQAHERVRVGVTVGGIYDTQSGRGEFFGGVQAPDGTTAVFGGTVDVSAWTVGLEAAAGIQADPTDWLSLGLSVRSPSLDVYSHYEENVVTTSAIAGGMTAPSIALTPSTTLEEGVHPSSLSPPRIRAGVAFRFPRGFVALDGDVQPAWSDERFQTDRRTVVNGRIGAIVRVAEGLSIGAGLFTDRSSERRPAEITDVRADFYGGTFGVTIDNAHDLAEGEDADHIVFSSTLALRYAYGIGEIGGLYVDYAGAAAGGELVPPHVDDLEAHEIGLHIGSALYF